jgi:hypothetical protein
MDFQMFKQLRRIFMKNRYFLFFGALLLCPLTGFAGHHEGNSSDHTSAEWQIEAYGSAAPDFIGDHATIIAADGSTIRPGSNGWICQSANPRPMPTTGWSSAHEAMPACHDGEGMQWMGGYMAGEAPELTRDTYMWMLHGDVGEDNTTPGVLNQADAKPEHWIESGPHLMLMPKDPATLANFTTDFTTGAPYVMFANTPYAHLMIPLDGYYQHQPESAPK